MDTKRSKYDTNPLDPDVERNAEESWGEGGGGGTTQQVGRATRQVGDAENDARDNVYSEAPTRRYENPPLEAPYPSVFVPPTPTYSPPAQYQARQQIYQPPVSTAPTSRSIPGIGIPEKWALMMPYAPYIGLVVSLIELFLVPRKEVQVRFHAAQALALNIAILMVQTIFTVIGRVTDSNLGGTFFKLATFIFLIISMIRVWKGEPHRIAALDEPGKWFNRHIEPRDQG
ncbi:MAG TPA: hypothetical protein VFR78_15345 [Pyrinomonadaceae bacterium]|nr:hypothetical protein [Pyrinomonadaceae bacterium]